MAFADTPAPNGATKVNFRGDGKPYSFQPYPSVRYHPDGRSVTVKDSEQDAALGEPWADTPYPPVPVVAPPPEPTLAEAKDKAIELAKENGELKKENADLKAYLEERMVEIADLRNPKKSSKTATATKTEAA